MTRLPSPGAEGRAGVTLTEMLMALVVALAILGGLAVTFMSIQRMGRSSEVAGAMQEASLAMAMIHEDLLMAVQTPAAGVDAPVSIKAGAIQMIRARPRRDGSVEGLLVAYKKIRDDQGRFRLRRVEGRKDERPIPGLYRDAAFELFAGPGGPYLRVTLRALATGAPTASPGSGSEEAVLTSLVRLMGPENLGSTLFPSTPLDPLTATGLDDDI